MRTAKCVFRTNPRLVRLGSSCVIALGLLISGFGIANPAAAGPISVDLAAGSDLGSIKARPDLFLEVRNSRSYGKYRSHRHRGFRNHRYGKYRGFFGHRFSKFRGFRRHHRYSRYR